MAISKGLELAISNLFVSPSLSTELLNILNNSSSGGMAWRPPVRVLDSVSTIMPLAGPVTIDDVAMQNGDRILYTNLSDPSKNNRVYKIVGLTGDLRLILEVDSLPGDGAPKDGDSLIVEEGTENADIVQIYNGTSWGGLATDTSWGSITGLISNQTDLQAALDEHLKLDGSNYMIGTMRWNTDGVGDIGGSPFGDGDSRRPQFIAARNYVAVGNDNGSDNLIYLSIDGANPALVLAKGGYGQLRIESIGDSINILCNTIYSSGGLEPTGHITFGAPGVYNVINPYGVYATNVLRAGEYDGPQIGSYDNLRIQAYQRLESDDDNRGYQMFHSGDSAAVAGLFRFTRQRGTSWGDYQMVQEDDALGDIRWSGFDSGGYIEAASIRAFVEGTPSFEHIPGRLEFYTSGTGGIPAKRMELSETAMAVNVQLNTGSISATGTLSVSGNISTPNYITATGDITAAEITMQNRSLHLTIGDGIMSLAGGHTDSLGGRIDLYGPSEGSTPNYIKFITDSVVRISLDAVGNLLWESDGVGEIGTPADNRPGNIYTAGALVAAANVHAGGNFYGSSAVVGQPTFSYEDDTQLGFYRSAPNIQRAVAGGNHIFTLNGNTGDFIFDFTGGNLFWQTDGSGNIGAAGANRPDNVYIKTRGTVGDFLTNNYANGNFRVVSQIVSQSNDGGPDAANAQVCILRKVSADGAGTGISFALTASASDSSYIETAYIGAVITDRAGTPDGYITFRTVQNSTERVEQARILQDGTLHLTRSTGSLRLFSDAKIESASSYTRFLDASGNVRIAYADSGANVNITPTVSITLGAHTNSGADNTYELGGSSNRWSKVWSNEAIFNYPKIVEGSGARMGVATLSAGTVTVANGSITANTRIYLTPQGNGTGTNLGSVQVSARVASTSFTITSSDGTDDRVIAWQLIEPA